MILTGRFWTMKLHDREAVLIMRTEWTSRHSLPLVHLTQPWELTSPSRLQLLPPLPLPNQQQLAGKNSYLGILAKLFSPLRRSVSFAHFRLQDSDWLPRYTNAHSYTNTDTHIAPQTPSLPLKCKSSLTFRHTCECIHCINVSKMKCDINQIWGCSCFLFFDVSVRRRVLQQLSHEQPDHIRILYCGEAQEGVCHLS